MCGSCRSCPARKLDRVDDLPGSPAKAGAVLADEVLLKIVCLLMRWLSGLRVLVLRGDRATSAELLVLWHQNAMLRQNAGRVRYEPAGRVWFATLTRFIPRGARRRSSP
jgi:hypothetical protein